MRQALVIAGTHSGVGKTTISTALMAAFRRRGLVVQGFKVGPDFIDPGFHATATGRPSYNLDGWMLSRTMNCQIFAHAMDDADLTVIEGVMGLFDGASGSDESGSTAEMAKWLGLPVVLVIDAAAQARSAAALVHGFETFDPGLRVAAVIANRVAGEGHYRYLEEAIRLSCRAEPVGWLAEAPSVALSSRHLGLITAPEVMNADRLKTLADWVEEGIDLDRLLSLAVVTPDPERTLQGDGAETHRERLRTDAPVRIGVARDQAFCFYYQSNLDLLESLGAELVPWSPKDDSLPTGLRGLYFGGGYPELYAAQLTANVGARCAVNAFVEAGGVVYAECGGFMYLTEAIVDTDGAEHPMVGIFPTRTRMRAQLVALGYAEVEGIAVVTDRLPLAVGETARGHQFRFSEVDPVPESVARGYRIRAQRSGDTPRPEGYLIRNCLGSYVHLHFLSNPGFAARVLDLCRHSGTMT